MELPQEIVEKLKTRYGKNTAGSKISTCKALFNIANNDIPEKFNDYEKKIAQVTQQIANDVIGIIAEGRTGDTAGDVRRKLSSSLEKNNIAYSDMITLAYDGQSWGGSLMKTLEIAENNP